MKTLDQIIEDLGYSDVVIKPHEWREIAEAYRTNALKEAAEKIEEQNVTVDAAYITETAINIGLRRAKNIVLSLIKDTKQ